MTTFPPIPTIAILTTARIGDPDGTRTVTSIVALLVALGFALLLLAIWIYRTTRPDPELLAPLEAMGERSWRRGDPVWQRRRLDELRPEGAKPLAPSVAPPELDASFDQGPTASGFDDLQVADGTAAESGPVTVGEGADTAVDAGADQTEIGDVVEVEEQSPVDATPPSSVGPDLEDFDDDEFDPEVLAAARAELERELAESTESTEQRSSWQLDLFERDVDA